jgi:hypothetical protein
MNEQQLTAVKQALEALKKWDGIQTQYRDRVDNSDAITTLQSIISQDALDKMAENARDLGLDYEPAPVRDLPFGVGGGLVAIKTLLGRDPCVHANTAIEMIDAILKKHPAAQPAVQKKCFLCGERVDSCASDVCPKSAQPAVIQQMVDALDHADELLGGNDTLVMNGAAAGRWLLEQPAVQEGRDWSLLEATQESLREHMAEIKRLKAAQPVKTYHDGKPWPVAPAPAPAPIIQQLVTALEGSGTRMRSDQWYIEIEAVAAGKFYLNTKGENL